MIRQLTLIAIFSAATLTQQLVMAEVLEQRFHTEVRKFEFDSKSRAYIYNGIISDSRFANSAVKINHDPLITRKHDGVFADLKPWTPIKFGKPMTLKPIKPTKESLFSTPHAVKKITVGDAECTLISEGMQNVEVSKENLWYVSSMLTGGNSKTLELRRFKDIFKDRCILTDNSAQVKDESNKCQPSMQYKTGSIMIKLNCPMKARVSEIGESGILIGNEPASDFLKYPESPMLKVEAAGENQAGIPDTQT